MPFLLIYSANFVKYDVIVALSMLILHMLELFHVLDYVGHQELGYCRMLIYNMVRADLKHVCRPPL